MKPRDPKTKAEWQEAVDAAEGAILLQSARQYGLVMGGPGVNGGRCEEILRRAAAKGIKPRADAGERFVQQLLAHQQIRRSRPISQETRP